MCIRDRYYTMGLSVVFSHLYVGATVLITNQSMTDKALWNFMKGQHATSFTGCLLYTSNDIDYIHRSDHGGGVVIGDPEFRDGAIRLEVGSKIRQYVFETLNMHRFSGAC